MHVYYTTMLIYIACTGRGQRMQAACAACPLPCFFFTAFLIWNAFLQICCLVGCQPPARFCPACCLYAVAYACVLYYSVNLHSMHGLGPTQATGLRRSSIAVLLLHRFSDLERVSAFRISALPVAYPPAACPLAPRLLNACYSMGIYTT
jgi:hypothetical protein